MGLFFLKSQYFCLSPSWWGDTFLHKSKDVLPNCYILIPYLLHLYQFPFPALTSGNNRQHFSVTPATAHWYIVRCAGIRHGVLHCESPDSCEEGVRAFFLRTGSNSLPWKALLPWYLGIPTEYYLHIRYVCDAPVPYRYEERLLRRYSLDRSCKHCQKKRLGWQGYQDKEFLHQDAPQIPDNLHEVGLS